MKPKKILSLIYLVFLICTVPCLAQQIPTISWKLLQDIKYERVSLPGSTERLYSPVFGAEQLALNGRVVKISGFIIPADEKGEFLYLSSGMYANCFFCGRGSPATIVTVWLKKKNKDYTTDEFRTFKGRLRLNMDNPSDFFYILEDSLQD